jgi:molecular chaperone DnaJ
MGTSRDLYAVLGVDRKATHEEVRRAYKKLARKHHPDVNPGNEQSEARFKEISAAYEVLSDQDKRAAYDEFGEDALASSFDPEQARAYRRWQKGRTDGGVPFSGERLDFDLADLFGGLGGIGGFDDVGVADLGGVPQSPLRGHDVRAAVELELEQAIRGAEVTVMVPVQGPCTGCAGTGRAPNTKVTRCSRCGGSGRQQVARGPLNMVTVCESCHGRGESFTPCPACQGAKRQTSTDQVRVRIPPGADDGSTLRISGKGAGGAQRGDLVIETRVKPHPVLRRSGLDLTMTLPITLSEAYDGAKVEVPTFDGPVSLRIPARSQSGQRLRLRGRGVQRGSKRGDLFVELQIRMPDRVDEELSKALRDADEAYTEPVRAELSL